MSQFHTPDFDLKDVVDEVLECDSLEQWGRYINATKDPEPSRNIAPSPMFKLMGSSRDEDDEPPIGKFDPDHCEEVHDIIVTLPELLQRVLFAFYCQYKSIRQCAEEMPVVTLGRNRTSRERREHYNRLERRKFSQVLRYAQGMVIGRLESNSK